jgi:hypothetical protein
MTRRRLRLPAAIALLAQYNADLHLAAHSFHCWWDGVRARVAQA